MSWFVNHYLCPDCDRTWSGEWSCTCDDECPACGARDVSPCRSDDLTAIVKPVDGDFAVFRSGEGAEADPEYEEVDRFGTDHAASVYSAGLKRRRPI